MEGTLKACENFGYTSLDGRHVSLGDHSSVSNEAKKTRLYVEQQSPSRAPEEAGDLTSIRVENRDCLEEAILLKAQGLNPAVLNMASPKRPGGGYLSGAGAQEENLFRRTNYVQHLADPRKEFDEGRKHFYRLPEFSCVYSTNVLVFRASEDKGYAFLPKPIQLSFLAAPAYPNPQLTTDKQKLVPEVAEKAKRKIRNVLAVALTHGHDSLVLSAWGCGAFRNPPRHIANLFKEVLSERDFLNRFKHISFAIIDDNNARGEGNFKPFKDVFAT